jgi:hypothetical protein
MPVPPVPWLSYFVAPVLENLNNIREWTGKPLQKLKQKRPEKPEGVSLNLSATPMEEE